MATLVLLKQKTADRVRFSAFARDELIKRMKCVNENNTFSLNPFGLFQEKSRAPGIPPTAQEVKGPSTKGYSPWQTLVHLHGSNSTLKGSALQIPNVP